MRLELEATTKHSFSINLLSSVTKIRHHLLIQHRQTFPSLSSFSELIEVCQHSTEFHFPSIDDQLEKIRCEVKEAVAWRQSRWGCSVSGEHLANLTSSEQQVCIFNSVRHKHVQVEFSDHCLWIFGFVTASFVFRIIGNGEKNILTHSSIRCFE
jgi:hypothetical protein